MGYKNKDLSVLAYANGFTLWHYSTRDDIDMIETQRKYFTPNVVRLMNVGDMIIISSRNLVYMRCITHIENDELTLAPIR